MKIRQGFVSNSSSSSFLVFHINNAMVDVKVKPFLTSDEIELLKENGFKETGLNSATLVDVCHDNDVYKIIYDDDGTPVRVNFAKSVLCNENDEIGFLVYHNIAFIATCHYGHYTVLYQKDSKNVRYFNNLGDQIDMYFKDADFESPDYMLKHTLETPSSWCKDASDVKQEYIDFAKAGKININEVFEAQELAAELETLDATKGLPLEDESNSDSFIGNVSIDEEVTYDKD